MPRTIRGHGNQTITKRLNSRFSMWQDNVIYTPLYLFRYHQQCHHHRPSMATTPMFRILNYRVNPWDQILKCHQSKWQGNTSPWEHIPNRQGNTSQSCSSQGITNTLHKTTIPLAPYRVTLVLLSPLYMVTLDLAIQTHSPQRLITIKMFSLLHLHHRHRSNHRFNFLLNYILKWTPYRIRSWGIKT